MVARRAWRTSDLRAATCRPEAPPPCRFLDLLAREVEDARLGGGVGVPWHTLKVALVDPTLFSGIGNAYSDEILHRARLSPVKLTARLAEEETEALFLATKDVLTEWTSGCAARPARASPTKA